MQISIILPCFNECRTIGTIIEKVLKVDLPFDRQIIVVDDCSTDGTQGILRGLDEERFKIVFHEVNQVGPKRA